jgi:hypothetical protein
MIKTPAKDFHNLLVPGEPNLTSDEASAVPSHYKQPYAKKMPENSYQIPGTEDLNILITLSSGTNPYRTQKIGNSNNNQALMILTFPNNRLVPVTKIAG